MLESVTLKARQHLETLQKWRARFNLPPSERSEFHEHTQRYVFHEDAALVPWIRRHYSEMEIARFEHQRKVLLPLRKELFEKDALDYLLLFEKGLDRPVSNFNEMQDVKELITSKFGRGAVDRITKHESYKRDLYERLFPQVVEQLEGLADAVANSRINVEAASLRASLIIGTMAFLHGDPRTENLIKIVEKAGLV